MQLSLHSDYACRVLIYLALVRNDERVSIEDVAEAFQVSKNHLVKIVHLLGKLGYVETTRGRGGGIKLAKNPEEIAIGKVVRKTEPHFDVVECLNRDTNTCPIVGPCGLKPWLAKAMTAFLATLDEVTLADVVRNRKGLSGVLGLRSS